MTIKFSIYLQFFFFLSDSKDLVQHSSFDGQSLHVMNYKEQWFFLPLSYIGNKVTAQIVFFLILYKNC